MKFPTATEQILANQSSVKCTLSVKVQNVYKFVLRSAINSVCIVHNLKEESFAVDTKYNKLIFMKILEQRNKSG